MKLQPKYVFLAYGIGITPFRSMIKQMLDEKKKEDIMLLYKAKNNEYLFQDLFAQAEKALGLKTVYVDDEKATKELLTEHIENPVLPIYYIAGPQDRVEADRNTLLAMGIENEQIKTDLFTGYS